MIALIVAWLAAVISGYYMIKTFWLKQTSAANWHEEMAVRWAMLSALMHIVARMP